MNTQTTPNLPDTPHPPESGNNKAKLLKIIVFEGDVDAPQVSVALPLRLAKWAGRLLPPLAKLIPFAIDLSMAQNKELGESAQLFREKYADFDFAEVLTAVAEVIEEGIDELEDIGPFDFVSVMDENEGVKIRIE
jgi:hypothetical protein